MKHINKKKLYMIAAITVAIMCFFVFKGSDQNFLVEVSDNQAKKIVESYLKSDKINFSQKNYSFYTANSSKNEQILVKLLQHKREKPIGLIVVERVTDYSEGVYLNLYSKKIREILLGLNPHLKYSIKVQPIGEKLGSTYYKLKVIVSDVLKRDSTSLLINAIKTMTTSVSALDLKVLDDEGTVLYERKYGLTQNAGQLKHKIEKIIHKLLKPILKSQNTYVLLETNNGENINVNVLIKGDDDLTTVEKKILSTAIEKKIKTKIKIDTIVEIKDISSLSTISNATSDSQVTTQDRFLYLLLLTTVGIFIYLLISVYIRNKNRYLLVLEKEKIEKQKIENLKQQKKCRVELCSGIENQIIHKTSESVNSFEVFLKKEEMIELKNEEVSSGEVCATVVKELEKEARNLLFEGIGTFLAEKIISLSSSDKLQNLKLEDRITILQTFYDYLEKQNSLDEFKDGQRKSGLTSEKWHENHYVELIRSTAIQKDFRSLIHFFDSENPLFITLVFVSLGEKLQEDIWNTLNFEQKEKMSLSLVFSKNINSKSLEYAYECFKEVS